MVNTNRAWGQSEHGNAKSSYVVTNNSEQAKMNKEIIEQLAQLRTSVDFVLKQN